MLDLSAPPECSSPLPRQKVGAEAIVGQMPPDVGERLRVDDAGTQLGQIAL